PVIEDEQTPWKMIKLLKIISLFLVAVIVFGLALCSKASFLVLITLANEGTKTLTAEHKPVALLCIGCSLISSSVLLFLKSIWKACYKTSKVIFFLQCSILTIVAMPHLDIVTNVTILNGVAVLSSLLQMIAQCTAKERNRFLLPSITAFLLILLGYVLFLVLYIMKNPSDIKMAVWVGLAVGGSFLVSFNWWENYFRLISENSSSVFLKDLCKDVRKCQNLLHILSSLLRIVVTACVLGATFLWIVAITVGVQLISSALCHWFAVAACKMHALRRCFIMPLYLASLAVMALYCDVVVDGRNQSLNGSVFPELSSSSDVGISVYLPSGSAVTWWIGLVLATLHLWYLNVFRIQRTQDLFIRRLYEGAFIEQSLLLNTPVMLYLCATMWHETYDEMMNIIISIFRLDRYRPKTEPTFNDFTFEAHIYFDDAFEDAGGSQERHLNEYAKNLVQVFREVYGRQHHVPEQKIIRTPYGGRLVITMPHGNLINVHFKDKDLIRHKKRWSQVMYLYYLLGWKLMSKYYARWQKGEGEIELGAEVQKEKHNTYILALDGDTDFQPAAVLLLIDRLRMYPRVGAACGRIHPTGSGPAVWFQKFEYSISHWLQKTAEHVIGCVLCSPGCFSLFRAEALMDDNVMRRYSTKSTEASHFIQYDQGEDRWLCTLLLKQGWRVEYNAASDAYTNAPEDFKELYNQRRRWGPSTLANVVDLLGATATVSKKNLSISKPFMFYQLFNLVSAILAPATICLMVAGSLAFIFEIHSGGALVIAVIPPIIYLILCFKLKSDTQISVAAVLSVIYAFLMLVVTMSIIGAMVKDNTILTPSSIFILTMAGIYVITAIMHPAEFPLVFYGLLYILCIPSAYLLLTIYSMVNMNNVSWGTRETKPAAGAATPAVTTTQTKTQKGKLVLIDPSAKGDQHAPCLCVYLQEEKQFWMDLQEKYLKPLPVDKEKQKQITSDLKELRNKINFAFFILNALWLVATFTLQVFEAAFTIKFPKVGLDLIKNGDVTVDPIGFMFIFGFATSVIIQFLAMFSHRVYTLIHYVAFMDTEAKHLLLLYLMHDVRRNE
uniref:chitin synthase n=1 Tax=Scophthalmus maximus TaxID=52904 RepID=A0A8D3APK5_SCOMX